MAPEAIAPQVTPLGARRIEQAISRLQALPAFYPTVQKALQLLEDPLSTNGHIQQVLSSDAALAARILRWANSAYFGFYEQVRTISLAVSLIGREKVSALLRRYLAEELISMLSGRKPAARQIREISLATATAAHAMAERLLRSDKEEILLAGLLHNIGELLLLSQFRDSYEEMLRLTDHLSREEAEQAIFGVESRLAGKWLLEAWHFPPFFPTVVERCVDPWSSHFSEAPMAAIVLVHTARRMAEAWMEDARSGRESEDINAERAEAVAQSFSPRVLGALEVDRPFLADLYLRLPGELQRWREILE